MEEIEIEFLKMLNLWALSGFASKRDEYNFVCLWQQVSGAITDNEEAWCSALNTLTNRLMNRGENFVNLDKALLGLENKILEKPGIFKQADIFIIRFIKNFLSACKTFGSNEFDEIKHQRIENHYLVIKKVIETIQICTKNGYVIDSITEDRTDFILTFGDNTSNHVKEVTTFSKENFDNDLALLFQSQDSIKAMFEQLTLLNKSIHLGVLLTCCDGIRVPSLRYYQKTLKMRKTPENISNHVSLDENYSYEMDFDETSLNIQDKDVNKSMFHHIIKRLDDKTVDVFFLYFQGKKINGSTLEQTAEQCDLTINQVRARVHQCYKTIFKSLSSNPEAELTLQLLTTPKLLALIVDGTLLPYRRTDPKIIIVGQGVLKIAEKKVKFILYLNPKSTIKLICEAGVEFGEQFVMFFSQINTTIDSTDLKLKIKLNKALSTRMGKYEGDLAIKNNLKDLFKQTVENEVLK